MITAAWNDVFFEDLAAEVHFIETGGEVRHLHETFGADEDVAVLDALDIEREVFGAVPAQVALVVVTDWPGTHGSGEEYEVVAHVFCGGVDGGGFWHAFHQRIGGNGDAVLGAVLEHDLDGVVVAGIEAVNWENVVISGWETMNDVTSWFFALDDDGDFFWTWGLEEDHRGKWADDVRVEFYEWVGEGIIAVCEFSEKSFFVGFLLMDDVFFFGIFDFCHVGPPFLFQTLASHVIN